MTTSLPTIALTRAEVLEKFPVLGTFAEHMDVPWNYAPEAETSEVHPPRAAAS